ncbi:MAG TPA: hypothetical protein VFT91_04535, partial [Dehalococcoidia bacterium]|nr:hypothetical protein [Dehalococcoidia bacterium]
WPLAGETVGERTYCYLIAGEAFDWLLLAERLCEELDGLIPAEECEDLLFHGRLPVDLAEADFRRHLGSAKYRAHLNFLYGVRVEEALQFEVQEEVHKERLSRVWENGHVDDEVCRRIYGATRAELLAEWRHSCHSERRGPSGAGGRSFAKESGVGQATARRTTPSEVSDALSLADLAEFTYWLFRYRLRYGEPARVASDTRKGLAALARLEARRRQGGAPLGLR